MQSELLKMAEGFSIVAEALTAIAKDDGSKERQTGKKSPEPVKAKDSERANDNSPKIGVEDIRAVLAEKSQDGKSKEVKALLNQYGVAKLSAVKEKDYSELLQKAKAL